MKSTLNKQEQEPAEVTYPCLKKSEGDLVVLFTDENSGTVVVPDEFIELGYYDEDWDECGSFTILPKGQSITLEN